MKSLIITMTLLFVASTALASPPPNNQHTQAAHGTLVILLNNISDLTIAKENQTEQAEYPAVDTLAESLIMAKSINGRCDYRGRSLIEDCELTIQRYTMGGRENTESVLFKFSAVKGKVVSPLRVLIEK